MSVQGCGMQVVSVLEDHSYELDEKVLEQVLLSKEIRDLPVVVVSVAGAYRGGKSFLLNFFLRYLTSPVSAQQDGSWLGADSAPLAGFEWRGGVERNTTGILLWSQPFITTLASGEQVAVLLMDTQGTFDSKSTVRDNSTIFALSTLISSVQIYNLSMNIKEDDLQHLQLFTMYGKMVQDKNQGEKAFQKLEFLVRDWPYPYDYPFGMEGGRQLLQKRLEITPNLPQELKDLRMHIQSSFEEVLCFLMPHPGFEVQNPAFKGSICDLDPRFNQNLKDFVSSLFSVNQLSPKTINGQTVKTGELFNYFKAYMTLFNSNQIPTPRNLLQATAEAGLLISMNEARDVYEKGMDAECGPATPGVPSVDVQELHKKFLSAAREAFSNKKTMASHDEMNRSLNRVMTELDNRLLWYEQSNLAKVQTVMKEATNLYEQKIRDISKGKTLCLHPMDLEKVHQEIVQAAMTIYDERVKRSTQNPDLKRTELIQSFGGRFVQLKLINDNSNKEAVRDIHAEYWKFLESKSVTPPISDTEFKRSHDTGLSQALTEFPSRRNRPSSNSYDMYKEDLIKTINDTYWRLQTINLRKIDQENIKMEQEKLRIEQEKIRAEQARIKSEQDRINAQQEMTRRQQEKEIADKEAKKQEELRKEQERVEKFKERMDRCSII